MVHRVRLDREITFVGRIPPSLTVENDLPTVPPSSVKFEKALTGYATKSIDRQ